MKKPEAAAAGNAATFKSLRSILAPKARKATAPRLEILSLITKKGGHMNAEEVYLALRHKKLGRATVFRALKLFVELGLIEKHSVGKQTFFEPKTSLHHHHMSCVSCGKLVEFTDEINDSFFRSIAAKCGFRIYGHRLELWGLCKNCAEEK